MVAFKKDIKYDWKIEINQDGMTAEFKSTAVRAFKVFRELNYLCPGCKMYCDGKLIARG